MSVTTNQIIVYGCANLPESDSATVGGTCDFSKRFGFYDLASTMAVDVVSSASGDTATKIQIKGRDATGTIQTPTAITLTGTTLIANAFSGQTFERLIAGVTTGGAIAGLSNPGGTNATGDVAVIGNTRFISNHIAQTGSANIAGITPPLFKLAAGDGATIGAGINSGLGLIIYIISGTGAGQLRNISVQYSAGAYGTDLVAINRNWDVIPDTTSHYHICYGMLFEILPNAIRAITRMFSTVSANTIGGATKTYYEKGFVVNTNTVTALTSANIQILSENPVLPSGDLLDLALENSLNDSNTITNRQTSPTLSNLVGSAFVTQPGNIAPTGNTLPNSAGAGNSSNAQGIWLKLTLPAGTDVYKGSCLLRFTGATV